MGTQILHWSLDRQVCPWPRGVPGAGRCHGGLAGAELWCQGSGGAAAAWQCQQGHAAEAGGTGGRRALPLHGAGG